jgi:hypothetical protein
MGKKFEYRFVDDAAAAEKKFRAIADRRPDVILEKALARDGTELFCVRSLTNLDKARLIAAEVAELP